MGSFWGVAVSDPSDSILEGKLQYSCYGHADLGYTHPAHGEDDECALWKARRFAAYAPEAEHANDISLSLPQVRCGGWATGSDSLGKCEVWQLAKAHNVEPNFNTANCECVRIFQAF